MGIEIERKFLVKNNQYRTESYSKNHIFQGYICSESGRTVRVRIKNDKGFITIKGPSANNGLSRFEWEQEIPVDGAKELLQLCGNALIEKYRYEVKSGKHVIEVDEFLGDNNGLVVAEIELDSENEDYLKPNWLGKEVTGERRYYNSMLIKNPFCKWEPEI
jgi:adenylate cyclase